MVVVKLQNPLGTLSDFDNNLSPRVRRHELIVRVVCVIELVHRIDDRFDLACDKMNDEWARDKSKDNTIHDHLCNLIQQLGIRSHGNDSIDTGISGSSLTTYVCLLELALGTTSPSGFEERVPQEVCGFSESVRGGANGDVCAVRGEIVLAASVQQRVRYTGGLKEDVKFWRRWVLGQYLMNWLFSVVKELEFGKRQN